MSPMAVTIGSIEVIFDLWEVILGPRQVTMAKWK